MKLALCLISLLALSALAFWLWTPDRDRAELELEYGGTHDRFIDAAGCRLHVRDTGPAGAPAIVLIHGFGSSLQTWDAWARALEGTHRVVRFDLPGSGLSAPDPTGDYTDRRSLQVLTALLDRLGLARVTIAGHSIGGRIAWTFAALHPDRVDHLVLVDPDGFASPGMEYGKAPVVPALFKLMRYALPRAMLRSSLQPAYANPDTLTEAVTTRYYDLMRAPGSRQALLERMKQTVLVDPVPLLARIRAPTLLVWGESDAMIPFSNSADYLKAIPGARLAAIADAGHLPQEEAAQRSADAVAAFLAAPAAPSTASSAGSSAASSLASSPAFPATGVQRGG